MSRGSKSYFSVARKVNDVVSDTAQEDEMGYLGIAADVISLGNPHKNITNDVHVWHDSEDGCVRWWVQNFSS